MIDFHTHILPNIDDGSKSVEETFNLIKEAETAGFDTIISTSHYMEEYFETSNEEKRIWINTLNQKLKEQNINVQLYLGNEIFINDHIVEGITENKIYTLNNSKYLLFELPFHNQILGLADIVYEMKVQGYIPILAHPERYSYFQENYKLVDELKEEGLLFQCNYASILGFYGKEAEKLLKYMLKNEYVDYLGTDIHHINKTYVTDNFKKIEKMFNKIASKEYYQEIITNGDNLVK